MILAGRRVANIVGLLLLVAIVVPFVIHAVPPVVGAEGSYVVKSGSMEPSINPGDVIVVYDSAPARIAENDIITYRTQDGRFPTTHRVVEVVSSSDFDSGVAFRTKGDANEDADQSLVDGSRLIGKVPTLSVPFLGTVVVKLPYMGYIVQFINTTYGYALFVMLPILLFIANEGWRIATRDADRSKTSSSAEEEAVEPGGSGVPPDSADGRPGAGSDVGSGYVVIGSGADDGTVITKTDLRMVSGVLALTTVYAGWVAYNEVAGWSVAAVVASLGGLVFALGLRRKTSESGPVDRVVQQRDPEPPGSTVTTNGSGDRIVTASLPLAVANRPHVELESLDELLQYANVVNRLVIEDEDTGMYYLADGDVLYTAVQTPIEGEGAESGMDAGSVEERTDVDESTVAGLQWIGMVEEETGREEIDDEP